MLNTRYTEYVTMQKHAVCSIMGDSLPIPFHTHMVDCFSELIWRCTSARPNNPCSLWKRKDWRTWIQIEYSHRGHADLGVKPRLFICAVFGDTVTTSITRKVELCRATKLKIYIYLSSGSVYMQMVYRNDTITTPTRNRRIEVHSVHRAHISSILDKKVFTTK